MMEQTYYQINKRQLALFGCSLLILITGLLTDRIIILAILCLVVINTTMLHFTFFVDTRNRNPLNWVDLTLQVLTLVFILLKFSILSS